VVPVITSLGVVGAGIMGAGIAQVAAQAGINVTLVDNNPTQLDDAKQSIEGSLGRLVEREKLKADDIAPIMQRIECHQDLTKLSTCQFVVEAVPEDLKIKSDIFRQLDEICDPKAVLATNTSSFPIGDIARQTERPAQVIGLHFFNPVPRMALVEVIPGEQTDQVTLGMTLGLAILLGKEAILPKDTAGFIVNRLLMIQLIEAIIMSEEGTGSIGDIDTGVKLGLKHPMGLLELADLIGLETNLAIMKVLHAALGERFRPPASIEEHVAEGRLGRKTLHGFYKYDDKFKIIG